MRTLFLAAIGCALAAPVYAADTQPAANAPTQTAAVSETPNTVVCVYYYHQGTIIRRPYCRTRHAWETEQKFTQQDITDFQLHSLLQRR